MCLLLTQTKNTPILSNEWLKDFYSYNEDGIGVMYVENNQLIIKKSLPKNVNEFIDFYHDFIKNKNCAWHLRMRTHGLIDLENCHPYMVLNQLEHGIDLYLMHNGVLSNGNKKDTNKSDTWHYINDFLKPMLCNNPNYAFTDSFKALISDHIGNSNKFVIMDNLGRESVINQDSGYYWHGFWLSNTYAWTATNSVSKTPIKNKKIIKSHTKEFPIFNPSYNLSNWNYSYKNEDQYLNYENQDAMHFEIDQYLNDFQELGLLDASNLSFNDCIYFCEDISLDAFLIMSDDLLYGNITESDFCNYIKNYKLAQSNYPEFKRYANQYKIDDNFLKWDSV